MKNLPYIFILLMLCNCSERLLVSDNRLATAPDVINQTIKIKFRSVGCFTEYSDSLVVLSNGGFNTLKHGKNTKRITKAEFKYFVKLEKQLRQLKPKIICTTNEEFIITKNNISDTIFDGNCEFDGAWKLSEFIKRNGL